MGRWFAHFWGDYRDAWDHTGVGGRAILLGCLAYIVRSVGFTFLMPLFAKENGLSSSQYGLSYAVYSANMLIAITPILTLSRRGWDRRLIMGGPLVSLPGIALLLLAPQLPFVAWPLGMLLCGTGGSTFWVLSDPLLAESTDASYRSRIYALKFVLFTIGSSIGILLTGLIPDALGLIPSISQNVAFGVTLGLLGTLDVLQAYLFRHSPNRAGLVRGSRAPVGRLAMVAIAGFAVTEVGFAFGYNSIRPFLSLFFTERHGLSSGQAGLIVGGMALVGGVGAILMPVLAGRIGTGLAIGILRVAGAVAIAAWFVQAGLPLVVAMTLVYYGVIDGTEALYISEIMSRLPPELRDVMAGMNALLWSMVASIATLASGWIQDRPWGGYGPAFAVGVVGYIVSALWTLLAFPRITSPAVGEERAKPVAA